ncbi:hypothetical protein NM208_g3805 [Fusarium decemcellulare]|uniref:Uncharacterized protein n=1 Tax=Fusarium decemcellulare TaxID=57161 RepID=A0ACC1SN09_9HYPO|nr:hypothetical protein NM208_g3805 [Fusarium decemcellulare]
MGEVVAFIAAVPAFIQLTKYCGKFAGELYYYSEEREGAKFEIENYANQAKCSSSTIRTSHASLERYHLKHPESIVLQNLGTEGTLKATVEMSKNISTRLKSAIDNLKDQNDTHSATVRYIKWRLRKKGVLEILLQLDRVQSSMQLIINLLSIEASELKVTRMITASERKVNKSMDIKIKELEKHIREQKQVIKDQLKTISRMEEQARRYGIDKEEISHGQMALHRIGNSILVGVTVPLHTHHLRPRAAHQLLSSDGLSPRAVQVALVALVALEAQYQQMRAPSVDVSDFSQNSGPDESDSGMGTTKGIPGLWEPRSPQDIEREEEERDKREQDRKEQKERERLEREKREREKREREEQERKEQKRKEEERQNLERQNLEREIQNLKNQKIQKRDHELVYIR